MTREEKFVLSKLRNPIENFQNLTFMCLNDVCLESVEFFCRVPLSSLKTLELGTKNNI